MVSYFKDPQGLGWLSSANPPGSPILYARAEAGTRTMVLGPYDVSPPGFSFGQWVRFWTNNVTGTTQWRFHYRLPDGSTFTFPVTYDPGFKGGTAMGETGRWGSNTVATDEQKSLQYRELVSGTYSWVAWSNNDDVDDGINGYRWSWVATDHYKVVSCTKPC